MKMWWVMVIIIHSDDYSKKSAYFGHFNFSSNSYFSIYYNRKLTNYNFYANAKVTGAKEQHQGGIFIKPSFDLQLFFHGSYLSQFV